MSTTSSIAKPLPFHDFGSSIILDLTSLNAGAIRTISVAKFDSDSISFSSSLPLFSTESSLSQQIKSTTEHKLPIASINFCLLILGASVGCRFAEKTIKEIANNSFHGLVATIILVLLGLVAAYIATFFVDTNFLTLILSFSPGGIYEVAVIAIAYNLEPDFVAFHHIIRLLMILFTVPVILKLIKKN